MVISCSKRGKLHKYWVYSKNKYFIFGVLILWGVFFFLPFFLVGFGFSPTLGVELADDWALCLVPT
ncbi:hypothetical protein CsSME_00024741 [Camellia sinensis var. sinensis]